MVDLNSLNAQLFVHLSGVNESSAEGISFIQQNGLYQSYHSRGKIG